MMDMLSQGFVNAIQPHILLICMLGVFVGIIIGALPGLTATMGVALLLPITFGMEPAAGLLLLSGVYFGGVYGGSITAILLRTPGTPAAAATAIDGYALTKKGMAGKALGVATVSSFIGGVISVIILIFLAPILARVALEFSASETFALATFGLCIIASISGKHMIKGLITGVFGLLLAMVGLDSMEGIPRFTMEITYFQSGIPFIPVMIGLFAASEAFRTFEDMHLKDKVSAKIGQLLPTKADMKRLLATIIRSSGLGTFIGIIPGAGADIAAFVSYNEAKRFSKTKEEFGHGSLEGVSASEAGANACTGGAFVPLLTLGIPGDGVTAVMLGALLVQGLQPGPLLFQHSGPLVYTLFVGMIICYIFLLVMGFSLMRFFVKILVIPKQVLAPIILVLCIVGSYAINNNLIDVSIMLIFGIIGYVFQKYDFPVSPIVLALILGPMAESSFRRALVMSNGSYDIFFTRPVTVVLLLISAITLLTPIVKSMISAYKAKRLT